MLCYSLCNQFCIHDGREEAVEEEVTVLRVEPLTAALLTIRLASPHHAFSLGRSVTTRQPGSVFWLRERLASHDPYCHTPALPPSLLFPLLPSHNQVSLLVVPLGGSNGFCGLKIRRQKAKLFSRSSPYYRAPCY